MDRAFAEQPGPGIVCGVAGGAGSEQPDAPSSYVNGGLAGTQKGDKTATR
jgi:hypothetical protein